MRGGSATAAVNGALEALVRTLAVELAPVRVNAVSPGIIATPTWDGMAAEDRTAMFDRLAGALPAGRVGTAEDLAAAIWLLLTNGFVTGIVAAGRRRPPARRPLTMRAIRVDEADAFLALAGPFLRAREAEHNLALGLLGRLRTEPRLYGFDPTFVVVEDAGEVVGCLLRTPPHGVVLSRFDDLAGVDAVAAEVIDMHPGLPGAVGPAEEAARFADAWSRSTGASARIAVRQRVHAAAEVHPVPRASGHMRETRPDDVPTVLAWLRAFADEALGEAPHVEDVELTYRRTGGRPERRLARLGRRRPGLARRVREPDAERHPRRPRLHAAGAPRARVCDVARRRSHRRAARSRPRVLLPVHRPREPDLERDLRPDRLRAGRRLGSVVVRAARG